MLGVALGSGLLIAVLVARRGRSIRAKKSRAPAVATSRPPGETRTRVDLAGRAASAERDALSPLEFGVEIVTGRVFPIRVSVISPPSSDIFQDYRVFEAADWVAERWRPGSVVRGLNYLSGNAVLGIAPTDQALLADLLHAIQVKTGAPSDAFEITAIK